MESIVNAKNMKEFCISVLIHNAPDRAEALRRMFTNLSKHINTITPIDVKIFINQTNDDIDYELDCIITKYDCNIFNFECLYSEENLGCGMGINMLNTMCIDYEYVMFIESDWICIPETPNHFIETILSFMKRYKDVDALYLRRFKNDYDMRCYSGQLFFEIDSINNNIITHNEIPFRKIEKPHYTNNPVLRRNKSFYDVGIYPFPQIDNEVKGSPTWSKSEEHAEHLGKLLTWFYVDYGYFVHHDMVNHIILNERGTHIGHTDSLIFRPIICKHTNCTNCKFHFLEQTNTLFCDVCESNEINESIQEHDIRHIEKHHHNG